MEKIIVFSSDTRHFNSQIVIFSYIFISLTHNSLPLIYMYLSIDNSCTIFPEWILIANLLVIFC